MDYFGISFSNFQTHNYFGMSFFAKGDFKIQESWDSNKNRPNSNRANSRSSNRAEPKSDSLMHQLGANYVEPTTDIIDDSLSRLLMKERGGAIPTPIKKDAYTEQKNTKKPPQPQSRTRKQSEQDKDLLSSMASRLQKLEKTCQSQRLQIKEQKEQLEKVKTENAFLKGMKQDSSKTYQQMNALKKQNQDLTKKASEMQQYLQKYGLKWVGNKIQGQLNSDKMKKDIKESKYLYRLPSEIDLSTIQRRVAELNAGLESQGFGTEIYNEKGVHKFRKAEHLPIAFYSNGIVAKGYNFYSYKSKESLKILADIVDGYFPYIFKAKYPDGVLLQVVDKVEEAYVQQKKETSINTLGSSDDKNFQPKSKEEFLNDLPKQVVKNGKVYNIRGEIEKIFDGAQEAENRNDYVEEIQGSLMIKSPCYHSIQKGHIVEDEICVLKIRDENGSVYLLKMFKTDKVIDVFGELRKVAKFQFKLMSNYPRRDYKELEEENLEELGFFPNANLHLQKHSI